MGIRLAGEDTTAIIKEEINLVIDAEIDKLKLPSKADTRLRSRLKDIEHRTYLWLYLIIDTIRLRAKASRQLKTFEKILDAELPSTIDEAYEAILRKSPDKKEATKLLHIVIGAERPLALDELNIALNIDKSYDGSQSFEDIELEDPELFPKRIRDICGLFVSISDSRVYLIHQTAKEFLVAKDSSLAAPGWKHSLHQYDSQSILAQICVSYLYLNTFSEINTEARCFITSPEGQPHILNEDQFKFLKYASDYWMKHWEISSSHIDVRTIIDLCSPTVRRSIWFRACLGGKYPPKHLRGIVYTIRNALKVDNFEEVNTISPLMIASGLGLLEISKALLATPLLQSEVNQYWRKETALSFAIGNGEYKITALLINAGANINDIDSDEQIKSALEVALENNRENIVSLLLDNKAGVNAALITAAQNWIPGTPPPDLFELVLARDGAFEPRMRARLLSTVMAERSRYPSSDPTREVKLVLSYPTKSSIDETMQSPLFIALTDPNPIELCSLIINDPAIHVIDKCWSHNYSTGAGRSLIHYIVERFRPSWAQIEYSKLVRARGASLDKKSKGSAFYSAIYSGNVECVEFFLREDPHLATLYINGKENIWPLATVARSRDYNMVRCLLRHGADIDHGTGNMSSYDRDCYYWDILLATTHDGISNTEIKIKGGLLDTLSTQQLQKAIHYGFNIDMELEGKTFLSYAASSGDVDRVRWLVQHGANVDGQPFDGRSDFPSPLMEAIWCCDDTAAIIVDILLDYGANFDGPRDYKVRDGLVVVSPAHLAIIRNNEQVLQVLLGHNVDVNLPGKNYGILLKEASVNGRTRLMKLLVSHGAEVNAIGQGVSVLHEAILNRQPEAVSVLLDLGAYINILDYSQGTPLQLSRAMRYGEMITLLQRRGALEVCNLKSVGPSYFHHQVRRHTSTNSLVLSRNEIEMPDPQAFSRRRSVNLQTWITYTFDHYGTVSSGFSHEELRNDVLSDLNSGFERRKEMDGGNYNQGNDTSTSYTDNVYSSSKMNSGYSSSDLVVGSEPFVERNIIANNQGPNYSQGAEKERSPRLSWTSCQSSGSYSTSSNGPVPLSRSERVRRLPPSSLKILTSI